MKKTKLAFLFLALLLVMVPVLQGCSDSSSSSSTGSDSKDSGETVNLTFSAWGNPAEIKVYQKAVDGFMKENPNIKVKLVPIPSDGYIQKLQTQLQGSQAPDVFYVGDGDISKIIETGKLAPLGEFMNSSESYAKPDEFAEGLWGAAKKDDEIYGITVDCNPMLLYYNKKLLSELGIKSPQEYFDAGEWNFAAMEEVTSQLREGGKYGFIADNGWASLFSWIWANGGEIYNKETGEFVLDQNEKGMEAMEFLAKMVKDKNFTYTGSLPKGQGAEAMFMSGQVGMVAAGRWFTPLFNENKSLEWDYISWPSNTENKTEPVGIPTAYLAANNDSKHKEEAMKFVTYYTSKVGQEMRLAGVGNAIPSIGGIDEAVTDSKVPEHVDVIIQAREQGFANAIQSTIPGLDKEVNDIMDLMYLGKDDAQTTVTKLAEKANTMIAEHKGE
ncbi:MULTISPECIES: ABC transporter substrate-binding protein [Metabacillus]|jgi:multiple sugar transport system substrate-binding protein|uniref:Sugar ABC transporter substrate-binding protein n=3 Tax=Metabacillus TaxID=2675233 RepID=A0A179SYD6_9BACI|nr:MULTISPECIES: sugar ABC transporter substrate-binding protein [Metabacillus]OAS86846.1 sugar ABC transporter substrate-binding protein [Metabacillus litoralis]QNF29079.1 sugar ABC transporter substrate-binding protein [Metabacillus sp. KUDC1714]